MSDLEEMGYIVQPHTSAGRIPSDKGYRLYVDHLIETNDKKEKELSDMKELDEFHLVVIDIRCRNKCGIIGIVCKYLCRLL